MKYLSFLIICFFIFFFCHSCQNRDLYFSDCEQAVNKQMGSSAKMLSKKYHMRPCAVTVAMPGGNIKYLELKFDMVGPLPQDTIRKILLNSVHDFLNNINSDIELCSYLKNGKMNICDVGITLFFHGTKGYHIHEPEIGIASISKGKVEYIRQDPNEISIKGMKTTEESYEEALQILNYQVEGSAVHKRCTD